MRFLTILLLALFLARPTAAQKNPFAPYAGTWTGVLQYLDYGSGDTVLISARLSIQPIPGDPLRAVLRNSYPKEPGHEHSDTLTYSGPAFANPGAGLSWHTAEQGNDAGKPATLLHGYRFRTGELRLWKEVQWADKPGFFLRNQYVLHREKA